MQAINVYDSKTLLLTPTPRNDVAGILNQSLVLDIHLNALDI